MTQINNIVSRTPGAKLLNAKDVTVKRVVHDSREIQPGDMFAAVRGERIDGGKFAAVAIEKGAVAVLCEMPLSVDVPQVLVSNVRESMGYAAAACMGNPAEHLHQIGVTGTNGKTTVSYIIEAIFKFCKKNVGVMGTIEYRLDDMVIPADYTTPEAPVVQNILRKFVDAGADGVVMEVSSHGLKMGRVNGCIFDVVAFTNLSQDHLDFHRNMADYGEAKMLLFTEYVSDNAAAQIVLNMDDPFASKIVDRVERTICGVSCQVDSAAQFRPVTEPTYSILGIETRLQTPEGEFDFSSPLIGKHNLSNLLVALACAYCSGLDVEVAIRGLSEFHGVPGRLEKIGDPGDVNVFVDYAHTPDALGRVLRALQPFTEGRLICVFGCGGDRDTEKRPLMGQAVSSNSDVAIVADDNPRTEASDDIIKMIVPGVCASGMGAISRDEACAGRGGYLIISNRREAIQFAIEMASSDDVVLIAGKGHEDYVIVGKTKHHFDDREEARRAIQLRGK